MKGRPHDGHLLLRSQYTVDHVFGEARSRCTYEEADDDRKSRNGASSDVEKTSAPQFRPMRSFLARLVLLLEEGTESTLAWHGIKEDPVY